MMMISTKCVSDISGFQLSRGAFNRTIDIEINLTKLKIVYIPSSNGNVIPIITC